PAIGTITDFGTPTVMISAPQLFSGSAPDIEFNAPEVTVDILLDNPDVQSKILDLLADLRDNGLGSVGFLNDELPVIHKSLNDLIGIGIGDILDLYSAAKGYFDSFLAGGVNEGGVADLSGLIDWTIDAVIAHLSGLAGPDAPFSLSGGFDLATHELRLKADFDLEKTQDLGFD